MVVDDPTQPVSSGSSSGDKNVSGRRIRSHKKSRKGCVNCKIRKIKCDERRPNCKKCEAYRITCNYDTRCPELQMQAQVQSCEGAFVVKSQVRRPTSPLHHGISDTQVILSTINSSPAPSSPSSVSASASASSLTDDSRCVGARNTLYNFTSNDLHWLQRFRDRTIMTLGYSKKHPGLRDVYVKLACANPFFLHIILTLTIRHDQHMGNTDREDRLAAAFHWSQGAALLNNRISVGVRPEERDALWACAALLGALSFSDTLARSPHEAWPLNPALDLGWLNIIEGKKAIWRVASPRRSDSVFYPHVPDFLQQRASGRAPIDFLSSSRGLPLELLKLCGVVGSGNRNEADVNPYLPCLQTLANVMNIDCNHENVGLFMGFFGRMDTKFKSLLSSRDPAALLLLAYWYAKQSEFREWWIWPRAKVEAQAICIYLETYHQNIDHLDTLCAYPRRACNLL